MTRLHFGCFDQPIDGWHNTDITPHISIAKVPLAPYVLYKMGYMSRERYQQHTQGVFKKISYLDITKRFPYSDGVFECAFSAHVLEHLFPQQALFCISEVYRVLVKGGIIRIIVPDLDLAVQRFDPNTPDVFCKLMYESNQARDKNRHHWMYNENSMRALLTTAGFQSVTRCSYQVGKCPDVKLIDNRPDSLFMEGIK